MPKIILETSYFGVILLFTEKQSEYMYLLIGVRFATYGMDYSHEILANFLKIHILDDFRGI